MARVLGFIIVPLCVYLFWFYVHFLVLNESGLGDEYMSPAFQATLKNSPTAMNALDIHYYDNITLKHRCSGVYLHSYDLYYPRRYDDGRISSGGQQVSGIKEPNQDSYWQVIPAAISDGKEHQPVVHGDIIRLRHIRTGKMLLTHDVTSPWMPTNQEFTAVEPEERYNETLFKVVVSNGKVWQTHMTGVQLIHTETNVALWTHRKALPDWGLHYQEVNANRNIRDKSNYWVAMDIMGLNATEINAQKENSVQQLPLLYKFVELQIRMLGHNSGLVQPYPHMSRPSIWPWSLRGIPYWTNKLTREQIYMTGNLVGWWLTSISVWVFASILGAIAVAKQRNVSLVPNPTRRRLIRSAGFFAILWVFHYLPFFAMGRSLFLHHYLPAAACGYLLLGAVFQFLFVRGVEAPVCTHSRSWTTRRAQPMTTTWTAYLVAALILGAQIYVFLLLAPLTYGTPGLTAPQVANHKLLSTWDLAFAK